MWTLPAEPRLCMPMDESVSNGLKLRPRGQACQDCGDRVDGRLLCRHVAPPWAVVGNPFIMRGFRRQTPSLRACVASAFTLHNETFNIWSHLLGGILYYREAVLFARQVPPSELPVVAAAQAEAAVWEAAAAVVVACSAVAPGPLAKTVVEAATIIVNQGVMRRLRGTRMGRRGRGWHHVYPEDSGFGHDASGGARVPPQGSSRRMRA